MPNYKVEIEYKMRHTFTVDTKTKAEAVFKADDLSDKIFKCAANECDSLMSHYVVKVNEVK